MLVHVGERLRHDVVSGGLNLLGKPPVRQGLQLDRRGRSHRERLQRDDQSTLGEQGRVQASMLLAALVLLRRSLRDLETIIPALCVLGARHVAYGAEPGHYPVVGEVLIASMAQIAGEAWRPEHERAWAAAFDVVAGAMLDGAASAELDLAA